MNRVLRLTKIGVLRSSGAAWTYLLRDTFSTDVAAGAVNGTLSDSGHVRTVVDANLTMSIAPGYLKLNGTSANYDVFEYGVQTRQPGLIFISKLETVVSGAATKIHWGSIVRSNPAYSGMYNGGVEISSSTAIAFRNGFGYVAGGIPVTSTSGMTVFIPLRASGGILLTQCVGEYPLLQWIWGNNTITNLYPRISLSGSPNFGLDRQIVAGYWLPSPLLSDGFSSAFGTSDGLGHAEGIVGGIGSGGSGKLLSGTTWSVSGGKAINTPTLGNDIVANGNLETWTTSTNAGSWSKSVGGANSINQETTEIHGGSNSAKFDIVASSNCGLSQNVTTVVGRWYRKSMWAKTSSANIQFSNYGVVANLVNLTAGGWANYVNVARATSTITFTSVAYNTGTTPAVVYVDDISLVELLLANLLSLSNLSTSDVYASSKLTVSSGFQAGLALNWDSATTPANGVIAYRDGANVKLEKCVAGVWTTVFSTAATYSANAELVVSKIGTVYRVYYNNALIGASTIADAGIVDNTLHGLFSTDVNNQLDDLVIYASGTSNEYSTLGTI